jgi:hypothetical protein
MNTRGVQGGVAQRISSETVTLEYNDEYDNGDGSATPVYSEVVSGASVGALQSRDIQRLELAGIIVKNGVTIVLPFVPVLRPDYITHNYDEYKNIRYRVVDWSVAHSITVATCDLVSIGSAS